MGYPVAHPWTLDSAERGAPGPGQLVADACADVLRRLQLQAIAAGRKTVVKEYNPEGKLSLVFKHSKTPENWTTWGMC